MSQACTDVERLKLQSQKALDLGLHALRDEIKANAEALEVFNKLRDVVKQSAKRPGEK